MTRTEALEAVAEAARKLTDRWWRSDQHYGMNHYETELYNALADLNAASDDDWQPIAEAPLDGTPVWLFTTCHGQVEGWFKAGEWENYQEGMEYSGPLWVCADDAFSIEVEETSSGPLHGTATHFRPLPPPPREEPK